MSTGKRIRRKPEATAALLELNPAKGASEGNVLARRMRLFTSLTRSVTSVRGLGWQYFGMERGSRGATIRWAGHSLPRWRQGLRNWAAIERAVALLL